MSKTYRCACQKADIPPGDTCCQACRRMLAGMNARNRLKVRALCAECVAPPDVKALIQKHGSALDALLYIAQFPDGLDRLRLGLTRVMLNDPYWVGA